MVTYERGIPWDEEVSRSSLVLFLAVALFCPCPNFVLLLVLLVVMIVPM